MVFLQQINSPPRLEVQRPATENPLRLEKNDLQRFATELWTDDFLQKINVQLRPYDYQRELVQHAIKATNTIICLQSGSGKTFTLGRFRPQTWPSDSNFPFRFVVEVLFDEEKRSSSGKQTQISVLRLRLAIGSAQTTRRTVERGEKSSRRLV